MTPVPETTTLDATCISDGLRVPDDLVVHGVYRSAVNFVASDRALVTLAHASVGGLPSGILVRDPRDDALDFRAFDLHPGMPAMLTATRCTIGPVRVALEVSLVGVPTWSPRIAGMDAAPWRARRSWAAGLVRAASVAGGITSVAAGPPAMRTLASAIQARDPLRTTTAARPLIGLGPGLTPSGDDVLTGAWATLHAIGHPCAGSLAAALGDVDSRTTVVAAAMLRHVARGEVAERIHELLAAVLAPAEVRGRLEAAVAQTVAWGATSGSDLLAGVLLALDATLDESRWAAA